MEEGPEILHLDRHVVVVSKRAGLMVEPDRLGHPNVQELLEEELQCTLWVASSTWCGAASTVSW